MANKDNNICYEIQRNFEYFFEIMSDKVINTDVLKSVFSNIPHAYYNSVVNTAFQKNIDSKQLEDTILSIKNNYRKVKHGHCWWYNNLSQPQDLKKYLLKHHYQLAEQFIGLSINLSNYVIKSTQQKEFLVVHLTDVEQLSYWIYPFLEHNQYKNLMSRKIFQRYNDLFSKEPGLMHLVVFHKQRPVGCGSLLITNESAGLYNVALVDIPNQAKIINLLKIARLNLAKKNGCKLAVMQLPESIYRKGFYKEFEENMIFQAYVY